MISVWLLWAFLAVLVLLMTMMRLCSAGRWRLVGFLCVVCSAVIMSPVVFWSVRALCRCFVSFVEV
jgi:hypothetical protein